MRLLLTSALCTGYLLVTAGCSQQDQRKAEQQAAVAREKARAAAHEAGADARRLGAEAKQQANELQGNIERAVGPTSSGAAAAEKLRAGQRDLETAGAKAGVKLDRATMIARVKAKLASDAGLDTLAKVDVEIAGSVVTLNGTVSSAAQKQQAEQAATQASGVTRVIDNLQVSQ